MTDFFEIARFVGMENIVEGTVTCNADNVVEVNAAGQKIEGISVCPAGRAVNIFIRPEDVTLSLSRTASSARNVFPGQILSMIPSGPLVQVKLDCGFPLMALITRNSADEMKLEIGQSVYAAFKSAAIHIIAA